MAGEKVSPVTPKNLHGSRVLRTLIGAYQKFGTQFTPECPVGRSGLMSCSEYGRTMAEIFPLGQATRLVNERINRCGTLAAAVNQAAIGTCDPDWGFDGPCASATPSCKESGCDPWFASKIRGVMQAGVAVVLRQ